MKTETIIELINFFHKAPFTDLTDAVDFATLNSKAVRHGYVIHPDCCTKAVSCWLNTLPTNYNATFYKEWYDVVSKSRFELFIDQLIHYASTYGTDFSFGNGFVPNDGGFTPSFKELKVILPISLDDLFIKCCELVVSGIALNDKTVKTVCDFMVSMHNKNNARYAIDVNCVKNKEAQAILCEKLNVVPSDEFALLRYLVYRMTNKSLLIKDRNTIKLIKTSVALNGDSCKLINKLTEDNLVALSRIFLRFKPLFLAMKTTHTAHTINRLRKLAIKNHTPFHPGFWETLVSDHKDLDEIASRAEDINNFTKIRLIQCVNIALFSQEKSPVYNIRNGKTYVKMNSKTSYDKKYLYNVRSILQNSLVNSLKSKACKVKYAPGVNITLPASEKSFIGNYPFGTSIDMTTNNIVGIYWRNEWGAHDIDLTFTDFRGNRIGWNSSYYTKNADVIYSGDMTSADPEAVELMYMKGTNTKAVVKANLFNGHPNSKYRVFFANEQLNPTGMRNHMVDPNNIKFETMIEFDNSSSESNIGIVGNGKFILMNLGFGNKRVSSVNDHTIEFINTMVERSECFVDLKEILTSAGFTEVEDDETPDIDFTNLEKDTLINLLSK